MFSAAIIPLQPHRSPYDSRIRQQPDLPCALLVSFADFPAAKRKLPRLGRCPSGCLHMFGVHIGPAPPKINPPGPISDRLSSTAEGGVVCS